jgi:hypothetical protein
MFRKLRRLGAIIEKVIYGNLKPTGHFLQRLD